MSDEPIVEYLRSRGQVRPPIDLVGSIADAVEGVPQQRHSWFAPFMPAAAAVAAAGVVVVAAFLVGQGPAVGPPPGGSPTEGAVATPQLQQSPPASPPATLLEPGETATIDAADTARGWGSITLTRGDDVGGYDDGSVRPERFVVEIHVAYTAEREPDPPEFGRPDWELLPAGEPLAGGGRREGSRPTLATYPGAIDIFTNPLEGWLLFEVPREYEDEALELVYRPAGFAEPVMVIPVREPGPAPDHVGAATPAPTPAPVTYVEKDGYTFTVIDSAGADALFETPDTCTNPVAGYTVTYPDAWFTNTEIGDWPPCSWFSPVFYSVGDDPNEAPPQVAIVITVFAGTFGQIGPYDTTIDEMVLVDGFDARRREQIGQETPAEGYTSHPPFYRYDVILAPQPAVAPTLTVNTNFEGAADYELNKAVLDRIMALIQFDE